MQKIEQRLARLEKQAQATEAIVDWLIFYDVADGPPSRQPSWPPVVILMPNNHRDDKTIT